MVPHAVCMCPHLRMLLVTRWPSKLWSHQENAAMLPLSTKQVHSKAVSTPEAKHLRSARPSSAHACRKPCG